MVESLTVTDKHCNAKTRARTMVLRHGVSSIRRHVDTRCLRSSVSPREQLGCRSSGVSNGFETDANKGSDHVGRNDFMGTLPIEIGLLTKLTVLLVNDTI